MKVGFVQFRPLFGNVVSNIGTIEKLVASTEAELLVLPELATTGYTFSSREELYRLAEPFDTSESLQRLHTLASDRSCALVVGFAEKSRESVYNSAALLRPDGSKELYRKIHLFGSEKKFFQPGGSQFEVHEYRGIKIGIIICFDWIFPESIRVLSLKGAQLLCQPANLVLQWCQRAMVIRSLENRVFTITANRYGTEERGDHSFSFTGKSQITSPSGDVILQAPEESDAVMTAEIDPSEALNKHITPENDLFEDRRLDFYTRITER